MIDYDAIPEHNDAPRHAHALPAVGTTVKDDQGRDRIVRAAKVFSGFWLMEQALAVPPAEFAEDILMNQDPTLPITVMVAIQAEPIPTDES